MVYFTDNLWFTSKKLPVHVFFFFLLNQPTPISFFKFIYLYLFLAVLGLRFCARAFSSCGKRGPLFIAVRGPLTVAASLVVEHRLQTRRLSNCGSRAQLVPRHVGSSQTRARTRVPCIGRQILNHCATREALKTFLIVSRFSFALWNIQILISSCFICVLTRLLRNVMSQLSDFCLAGENVVPGFFLAQIQRAGSI